jgi:hypothetical protein
VLGQHTNGQLGDGTTTHRWSPVQAQVPAGIVELALGGRASCARYPAEVVRCWGSAGRVGSDQVSDGPCPRR